MSSVTWYIPAPGAAPAAAAALPAGKVAHVARALARLPQQFRGKAKIEALLSALASPAQDLENALWDLLTLRGVMTASGVWLDKLGALVGQARGGLSDAAYRLYIRARVATNRSRGTVADLIAIANLILNSSTSLVTIETVPGAVGVVVIRVSSYATDDATAAILISFLRDAVDGGVRAILETSPVLDAAFTTSTCVFGNGPFLAGVTAMAVTTFVGWPDPDVLAFPESGQIVIDKGEATEETVGYSFRGLVSGTTTFVLTSATTKAHADLCPMVLVDPIVRGFGDSSDAGQPNLTAYTDAGTTGGRMADARV